MLKIDSHSMVLMGASTIYYKFLLDMFEVINNCPEKYWTRPEALMSKISKVILVV